MKILTNKEYEDIKKELSDLELKYILMVENLSKTPPSTQEFTNRVTDLEIKMAKLWSLLIDYTPRGQEKLSRFGKRFGGKSKDLLNR